MLLKYLKNKLNMMIDERIILHDSYCSCDECGLVFSAKYWLDKHRRESGHRKLTIGEKIVQGVGIVFETASNEERRTYFNEGEQ